MKELTVSDLIAKFQKEEVVETLPVIKRPPPVVSVLVYTYNHQDYIAQCLDSIVHQKTNFNFEIYIGEDESTDRTREICLDYANKYPEIIRLFLHRKENKILVNNRPTGRFNLLYSLYVSKGKYLAFCEGDDYWTDPKKLQKQFDFMEANTDFSMCFTNIKRVSSNDSVILDAVLKMKKDEFTHEEYVCKVTPPTLTTFFKRTALPEKLPLSYTTVINSDMFLKAMMSMLGKIKYINEVTGSHRLHAGGAYTGVGYEKKHLDKINTYRVMLNYFKSPVVKKNILSSMNVSMSRITLHHARNRKISKALKMAIQTLAFQVRTLQLPPVQQLYSKNKD